MGGKPKWKLDRWLSESVSDASEDDLEPYRNLSGRELPIVIAALLDVALAELCAARLLADEKEATDFLGGDEDGKSPAGSFGARIQLAYLLGLLQPDALTMLRALKGLRNKMAHHPKASIVSQDCQAHLDTLRQTWLASMKRNPDDTDRAGRLAKAQWLMDDLKTEQGAKKFLLVVLRAFQLHLRYLHTNTERLRPVAVV